MEWKETMKDYKNERILSEQLKDQKDIQIKEIIKVQERIKELHRMNEEFELRSQQNQARINQLKNAKVQQQKQGEDRIQDLTKQLEKATADQNQLQQKDINIVIQQEQIMEMKETQTMEIDGRLKVQINFENKYQQMEIQEQLQVDKKSIVLKGYALQDFTTYTINKMIKLDQEVQRRESIELNGVVLTIIYK
ncbi:unnamed protein product [Paramecium sonneborni]|uniref:Uncharacterized protein n=1 Tax=Paramecium sonneborni TaxID=65129 RepID=A0A8S1R9G2_9CILI|nr:unnamed protein product [Paramecium sonneborni]